MRSLRAWAPRHVPLINRCQWVNCSGCTHGPVGMCAASHDVPDVPQELVRCMQEQDWHEHAPALTSHMETPMQVDGLQAQTSSSRELLWPRLSQLPSPGHRGYFKRTPAVAGTAQQSASNSQARAGRSLTKLDEGTHAQKSQESGTRPAKESLTSQVQNLVVNGGIWLREAHTACFSAQSSHFHIFK